MPLLGYRRNVDPEFNKQCVLSWVEFGTSKRAGEHLGIQQQTVVNNAWKYLLYNVEFARDILDSQSNKYLKRPLTDEEFMLEMTKKAMAKLTKNSFVLWCADNEVHKFPDSVKVCRVRYPDVYQRLEERANSEPVSE